MSKKCTKCGEVKELDQFYADKRASDGRRPECKTCHKKKYNRGEYKRNRNLIHRYGITSVQFDELLEKQGNKCAVCEKKYVKGNNRFHLDHCHQTKRIRGILCHDCNTSIGKLGDTAASIRTVLEYLEDTGGEE